MVVLALVAGACGGDDDDDGADTTDAPTEATAAPATEAPTDATEPPADTATVTTEPATTEPASTEPPTDGEADPYVAFPDLGPPTGEPIVVGLVNTEGAPGLDFPDIRLAIEGSVDYLNEHGGIGGRPITLETCVAAGSPETSQACAQELVGKDVELVMIGLDLFPDYATYGAAGTPVIGMLPILPGDYTADALFLTGGNATSMAATAAVAKDHFGAASVGIVSADNPGANGTLASLTAALDKAGITWTAVKGGDNETDAGYQGLMREAAAGNPDVLVSLYADAGCIGTMRGRASLGIEIPVLTTGICSGAEVIEQVGDDAVGWNFVGVATQEEGAPLEILQTIMAPVLDVAPEEVDSTALGLGGLGLTMALSIAVYGNLLAESGGEVTGAGVYDFLATSTGLYTWPGTTPIECGAATAYPSVCAFIFPVAEYVEGGEVTTIPGLEAVSALPYLP
ncbi:MAG: ABC transporter substrate-binding protein [Ilumatobacteraceae bacterium]|nr:ABC transporter substrate-binding protein [Ilumatobacteraceae bacterium]